MIESDFEGYLFLKGRKHTTISNHLKNLKVLKKELHEWTPLFVNQFITHLLKKGLRHSSINSYIDTIRLFARYRGITELESYRHLKKQNNLKSILSDEEILAFLNLPARGNPAVFLKWTLYFKLLAFSGMRCGELGRMTVDCVDFGRCVFLVLDTKTGVPRQVPIPPNCISELKEHVATLTDKYLFVTQRGNVFSDHAWGHEFKKRVKALGIHRPGLTPYSFRHSFATTLLEEDVNIHKIAKILGHDIRMTAQYEHLTTKDIQKAIRKHRLIKRDVRPTQQQLVEELEAVVNSYGIEYSIETQNGGIELTCRVGL